VQSAPIQSETNDVGLGMAYGAYVGGYAPRSPLQNSSNIAAQTLLAEVLEYAQAARRELVPPDRLHPEIQTSSGSLQYLAVVVEAFNHLPRVANTVGTPIAVERLRNLLSRAETIHQRACHREELQTEILILHRRLPATTDPVVRILLTDILRRRENEMNSLGR
nr:hypothetical protein [Armatimonadota bacterium]